MQNQGLLPQVLLPLKYIELSKSNLNWGKSPNFLLEFFYLPSTILKVKQQQNSWKEVQIF